MIGGRDGTTEETCLTHLFHPLHRMKKEELTFYLTIKACYVNPPIHACACIKVHLNVIVSHLYMYHYRNACKYEK